VPKLIFNDPESEHEVTLDIGDDEPEVTVGRNPGNTLRVNNPSISRRHAKFVWEGGEVTLYDLDSSNGCYVNGNRIRSQVLLDGDRLRIGEFPLQFLDEVDGATAEVSPDIVESVLNQIGHKQTHLGGFDARPAEPPPFDAPSNAFAEPAFGEPEAYEPESYGFSNNGAAFDPLPFDPEGVDNGFQLGGAPPPFPTAPQPDWMDDEPLDLEPDFGDGDDSHVNRPLVHDVIDEIDFELDSDGSVAEEDLDTRNAAPGEIANRLSGFVQHGKPIEEEHDSTIEQSVEDFMAIREAAGGAAGSADVVDLKRRLDELTRERDELADILENRASDAGAASQLQIERLRKERDRLSDERRNMMRQLNDTKKSLEESPSLDRLTELQEQVKGLQTQLESANRDITDFERDVSARDQTLEEVRTQLTELRAAASDRDSVAQQSAELGAQLSSANDDLSSHQAKVAELTQSLEQAKTQLDSAFNEIESLDREVSERDEKMASLTGLSETLQNDLSERDARLEDLRISLEESLAESEARGARVQEIEAELELRPVADEVVELRGRLLSSEEDIAALTIQRDELLTRRADLESSLKESQELVESINARYSKIGSEFDSIRKERDDLKDERVAFARETDYLQVERRRLTDEVEELRKRVKVSDKEGKRKNQIFEELSGDLRKLVQENNSLQDQVKSLDVRVAEAPSRQRLEEVEATLLAASEQVADLEQDNAGLTRDLGKFFEDKGVLETRVATLEGELELAQAAAASGDEAATALREIQAERDGLAEQIAEMAPRLEALEAAAVERDSLVETLAERDTALSELSARAEELEVAAADAAKAVEFKRKLEDAETTLAEIIFERDKLEDEIKKLKKK
jgi:chromosome segregation ATPase